jgi:hypothetical protein
MAKVARAELRSLRDESAASAATALNRVAAGDIFADNPIERQSMAQLRAEKATAPVSRRKHYNARTGEVTRSLNSDDDAALEKVNDELSRRNQILRTGIPAAPGDRDRRRTSHD